MKKVFLAAVSLVLVLVGLNISKETNVFASINTKLNMPYYNYQSSRGDNAILNNAKMIKVNDQKNLAITGIETIKLDSIYADITIILEERDDISAKFTAEGKQVDNMELSCVKDSATAAITLKLKENKAMQVKNMDLEIRIPVSFKNSFDINNLYGDLTLDGSVSAKLFKVESKHGDVIIKNDMKADDIQLKITYGSNVIGKNITATDVSIDCKYTDTSFDNIDADNAKISVDYLDFTSKNIKSKNLDIKSTYTDLAFEDITADTVTANISYGDGISAKSVVTKSFDIKSKYAGVTADKVSGKINADISYASLYLKCESLSDSITINGSYAPIQIDLPKNAAFKTDCSTSYGDIKNDFGLKVSETNYGQKKTLTGTVNSGTNLVKVTNKYSDIKITKY